MTEVGVMAPLHAFSAPSHAHAHAHHHHHSHRVDAPPRPAAPPRKPSTTAVRRRISKACDRCNQLRTKCDGLDPCKHCTDNSLRCGYDRARKKRGKVSKKDLARMQAEHEQQAPQPPPPPHHQQQQHSPPSHQQQQQQQQQPPAPPASASDGHTPPISNMGAASFQHPTPSDHGGAVDGLSNASCTSPNPDHMPDLVRHNSAVSYKTMDLGGFHPSSLQDVQVIHGADQGMGFFSSDFHQLSAGGFQGTSAMGSLPNGRGPYDEASGFGGISSPTAYSTYAPTLSMPSGTGAPPPAPLSQTGSSPRAPALPGQFPLPPVNQSLQSDFKYPVLKPVLPFIKTIIPITLANELLEHYFAGSLSQQPHPSSPYVLFFLFSRRSFTRQRRPRACSPALLASVLWIAARTCEAKQLTSSPASRGRICQKLLELTIKLLQPLIHRPSRAVPVPSADAQDNVSIPEIEDVDNMDGIERSANGTLDDVITYIHLGTVISASEYKAASLRWWNAAWGLAREMKLGKELPIHSTASVRGESRSDDHGSDGEPITEEEREERRRVWWLLFCVDRHLSLCYNKPLCLPDRECESLLQPMDEQTWCTGDFDFASFHPGNIPNRPSQHGPSVEFSGISMYGFFIPLMAILGEIIDLNHAKGHPRFGAAFISAGLWDEQARCIDLRLENLAQSIRTYSNQIGDLMQQGAPMEAVMQQKRAVAYSTHLMHVLHILLTGKWDPIALLDDADLWIYTQSFVNATGHAVSAAESASDILEFDPEISFMPFFFGIYLLQGSFLLLLMADKLGRGAAPNVIKACEDIIRCHESCAITLSTEYQRNFRKVMRSALAQVRGHAPDDFGEEEQRRREVLSLYRWTGDGTGLAL